jgi:hypothetical protein
MKKHEITAAEVLAALTTATDEEKQTLRTALGINQTVSEPKSVVRYAEKYERTSAVLPAKMAKQMKQCIEALTEQMDLETWGKAAVANGLMTQQNPTRIVAYYRKPMLEGGYIAEVK